MLKLKTYFCAVLLCASAHIQAAGFSSIGNSRANMQVAYALETGKQIISALDAYRAAYHQAAPDESVEWLVFGLLKNGQDPLVQSVFYLAEQSLKVKMQDTALVEEGLRGVEFPFKYDPLTQKWALDKENYPPTAPDGGAVDEDIPFDLDDISRWCSQPQLITDFAGLGRVANPLPPEVWCPLWLDYVWHRP
jgi:hypothetical protein